MVQDLRQRVSKFRTIAEVDQISGIDPLHILAGPGVAADDDRRPTEHGLERGPGSLLVTRGLHDHVGVDKGGQLVLAAEEPREPHFGSEAFSLDDLLQRRAVPIVGADDRQKET